MQANQLQVVVDPGASLSKAVYSINGSQPQILTMEPDVISLPASSIRQVVVGSAHPENQAWVKLDQNSDTVQVCGFLAREFLAIERIELLKYEHALYKLLAVVGAIAVREKLHRISIDAGILLPYGEINHRQRLHEKITKNIKRYTFQDTLIRAQLNSFKCTSEGSGMACRMMGKYGVDWFRSNRVIILIFGYRNISCITFNRGAIEGKHSSTCDLGFVKLIDKVISRTSGQNRQALAESVYAIGSDFRVDHPALDPLIKSTQPEDIEADAQMLIEAISMARREYWQLVQNWLDSVLPADLDRLAISGGTGLYLKNELDRHLSWSDPDWLDSKTGALNRANQSLQFRFADVMAFFESTFPVEKVA